MFSSKIINYLPDVSWITARIITSLLIVSTVTFLPRLHHSIATQGELQGQEVVLLDTVLEQLMTSDLVQGLGDVGQGAVTEL